jgi:hypothetical protein
VHISATDGEVEGVVLERSDRTHNCRINSQHVLARFESSGAKAFIVPRQLSQR